MAAKKKADVGQPGLHRNEADALVAFQQLMFEKLRKNRHKGPWTQVTPEALMGRVDNEIDELRHSLSVYAMAKTPKARQAAARMLAREAADVANFAMMLADVVGGLDDSTIPVRTSPKRPRTDV